ncbi:MAG TPA: class A beta-lactamase, subclass A2 [Cyclobacteriaceae bacterium]
MRRNTILLLTFLSFSHVIQGQTILLRQKIEKITSARSATIGVALSGSGDTLTIHGNQHFPMQSVYKFHLALAILDQVDKGKLFLDQKIRIEKSDLHENTWSPLRKDHPDDNVYIPLSKLLQYTVSLSDNNGCDILFRLLGGPGKVNDYIHTLGCKDVSIVATEEQMHKEWNVQYANWGTPRMALELLQKFYEGAILSKKSHDFLWQLMVESVKSERLKGLLPNETIVAHKSGTSDTNENGITAAVNDIGIIITPDKKPIFIAIFVSDSKETASDNEKIIAEIAKAAWDYFTSTPTVKRER